MGCLKSKYAEHNKEKSREENAELKSCSNPCNSNIEALDKVEKQHCGDTIAKGTSINEKMVAIDDSERNILNKCQYTNLYFDYYLCDLLESE